MERGEDERLPVSPGEVVGGKYRVTRLLGAGGMGVVMAAEHQGLRQEVALKFLRQGAGKQGARRFEREAQAVVQIKSEHICRVIDHGALPSGELYIAMELLEGCDLAVHVEEHGPFTVEQTAELLLQACEPLAEAHRLGIVHRDIKPSNLFLCRRADGSPLVKLLDFGISKAREPEGQDLTRTGAVLGSPRFMSPEQLKSARDVDGRSDVWALGAVLYELAGGCPAFEGTSTAEIMAAILHEEPHPLGSLRDAAAPLEGVAKRCLVKDRELRYQDVAELARALAPFAPPRAQVYVERLTRLYAHASGGASIRDEQPIERPVERGARQSTAAARLAAAPTVASTGGETARNVEVPAPAPSGAPSRVWAVLLAAAVLFVAGVALVTFSWVTRDPRSTARRPAPESSAPSAAPTGKSSARAPENAEPAAERPVWLDAPAIIAAVHRAHPQPFRYQWCTFHRGEAEIVITTGHLNPPYHRFFWRGGALVGPEPYFYSGTAQSIAEVDEASHTAAGVDFALAPVIAADAERRLVAPGDYLDFIGLGGGDGDLRWNLASDQNQLFRYDIQGNLVPNN